MPCRQRIAEPLLAQLRKRAPQVSVNLIEGTSDKLFSLLGSGAINVLFSRMVPPQNADGSVSGEPLFDDPLALACSRSHPLAQSTSLRPTDLADLPWVLPPTDSPAFQALNGWMHTHGLSFVEGWVRTASAGVSQSLIESGTYIGLMPRSVVLRAGVFERIRLLELPDSAFLGRVWLFHNRIDMTATVNLALECARTLQSAQLLR